MVKTVVLALLFGLFAWVFSHGLTEALTEHSDNPNRGAAYALSGLITFAASVLIGIMAATGPDTGQYEPPTMSLASRDRLIAKTFFIAILPALVGVRTALGSKPRG